MCIQVITTLLEENVLRKHINLDRTHISKFRKNFLEYVRTKLIFRRVGMLRIKGGVQVRRQRKEEGLEFLVEEEDPAKQMFSGYQKNL